MIIWLSSYPKSGNTLLRSILATYFFSTEGEFQFDLLYKIEQFPLIDSQQIHQQLSDCLKFDHSLYLYH